MRGAPSRDYGRGVIEPFVVGLLFGALLTGFCAVGSYNRGYDSVRRTAWTREHAARKRAVKTSVAARAVGGPAVDATLRKAS